MARDREVVNDDQGFGSITPDDPRKGTRSELQTRDGQTWPRAARRRPRWQSSHAKADSASVGWTSKPRRTRGSRRRHLTQTGQRTRLPQRPVPGSPLSKLSSKRPRTPDPRTREQLYREARSLGRTALPGGAQPRANSSTRRRAASGEQLYQEARSLGRTALPGGAQPRANSSTRRRAASESKAAHT